MGSTVCFCSFCTQHEIARFSLLRPSLPPSLKPRQRLTPTFSTWATEATVLATTAATDWATTVLATGPSMARGRLRPSPRLRLSPPTATTDLATGPTATATAMDLSTARVRLRLSPRLRLSLTTTVDTASATDSATAMVATVLATGPTGDKLLQSLQDLN